MFDALNFINDIDLLRDGSNVFGPSQELGDGVFVNMVYDVSSELAIRTTFGTHLPNSLDVRRFGGSLFDNDNQWRALGRFTALAIGQKVYPPITFSVAIFAFLLFDWSSKNMLRKLCP